MEQILFTRIKELEESILRIIRMNKPVFSDRVKGNLQTRFGTYILNVGLYNDMYKHDYEARDFKMDLQ